MGKTGTRRLPISTYRIQFNPLFDFQKMRKYVSYLADLGISDLYASPIFKARKNSSHGYDIVDQNRLNPDLGSLPDFRELTTSLKQHNMGWLQDIVPNHMAFDSQNLMLMDVLENGEYSKYFPFFDIDWEHPYENMNGRVLIPLLGKFYAASLEDKEIQLEYNKSGFHIVYYNLQLPIKIESYMQILEYHLNNLENKLGGNNPDFIKYLELLHFLKTLIDKEENKDRYEVVQHVKKMLWNLYSKNKNIKNILNKNIAFFNGQKGNPESFDNLDKLISEQLFRLSFWKVAAEEINYRRFFTVNELISIKIEDEYVFNYTHKFIFKLIEKGVFSGLRIDHIDGLYDPTDYLKRLRSKAHDLFIVVEKILDRKEQLPPFWPIQGTTGYDFLNYVNGLFCNAEKEKEFSKMYYKFTGRHISYEDLVSEKKRLIIGKHMAGDIDNLAQFIKIISSGDRYGSDITLYGLKRALVEVMSYFPVYRTYISNETFFESDRQYIKEAVQKARENIPGLLYELDFIEKFLLLDFKENLSNEDKNQWLHFVMRFQQHTGPLMAKGVEDTVLYIYNRLISLNEVGSNPNNFGTSIEEFHNFNEKQALSFPYSLNATGTHDTKRGEDVRARINVLSEIPKEWEYNLKRWSRINKRKRKSFKKIYAPTANDEYFLYQTLIGAFPFHDVDYETFKERIKNYIIKAIREAKIHTAWLKPDINYEEACLSFIEEILKPSEKNPFLREFLPFQKKIAYFGIFNSLSQTLIKITTPGIPDFYQGSELWDFNLVDPDNRRPVDFKNRENYLHDIKEKEQQNILGLINELLSTKEDGRIKLFLIYMALKARKQNIDIFQKGSYLPLKIEGKAKNHIIAYARNCQNKWAITIVPRFLTALTKEEEHPVGEQVWKDTCMVMPQGSPSLWKDAITGQKINTTDTLLIGNILKYFPAALLINE